MIKVEDLCRVYDDFVAVDQVSFTIAPGEIVGLLGHNGAGKTTIMKMLTGFLEPSRGIIMVDGLSMADNGPQIQKNIGYLPENCPTYPEMTIIDYLDYAAALHGVVDSGRRRNLVAEVIGQTALTEKAEQTIATLSRGFRQRVGVAQAILHKPRILILDEPTNGLDPTQIQQMRELIRNLAQSATIIISTHILQEVQAVCDRALIIKNGQLALDSRLDDLEEKARLLLHTDAAPDKVRPVLNYFSEIASVEELPQDSKDGWGYGLSLVSGANRNQTAAAVAKTVAAENWQLFALQPESRDLERIFAEISTS